ncbi:sensor histidine kinase [Nocardioides sp.]|uniref:sensor histidine kinase n=1 Tax=Nocardioides sp. TaxID=35761 RepID=UPI0037835C5A
METEGSGPSAPVPVPEPMSHPDHTGWSDSSARAVLQLMVESVAEMIGFEVAALSVVLEDELITMAYTGPEEFREYLLENADPVTILDPVVERGEAWGRFHFLPAERYDGSLDGHWVVTAGEQGEHEDAWHPLDVLVGLLTDDDGRLVGVLSVDNPVSGRRPDTAQRRLLERYAAQAERAVLTAFEREELVQQVGHAEAARRLVRATSMSTHATLEEVVLHTHRSLVEGFGSSGTWIHVLGGRDPGFGYVRSYAGEMIHLSDEVVALAAELAPRLWREQRVLVVSAGESTEVPEAVHRQLADLELSSVLAVPLGVGSECLGFLVLTRRAQDPPWSAVERTSALEIGHDLGAALLTSRALENERDLVHELQQLDDYRTQLIATLSHELRTPLTVISGNLELLDAQGVPPEAGRFVSAMTRGVDRMQKVVDDLLLLAKVSHPQHPLLRAGVDLAALVREVGLLAESAAGAKQQSVAVDVPDGPLLVCGDAEELDRMLGNLVSNAVKYTPVGGHVTVSARAAGDQVVLQVADDGLGISEEDQAGLFGAFFRTTNPAALTQPGTGLGLAIVATIVERHDGRVAVTSRLGEGTTFTVTLPAARE